MLSPYSPSDCAMTCYGLLEILAQRPSQASFHLASKKSLRIEFIRFARGQNLGPISIEGDVVVTCLEGEFETGAEARKATTLIQVVVPQGESLELRCVSEQGAVHLVFAPPFAAANQFEAWKGKHSFRHQVLSQGR